MRTHDDERRAPAADARTPGDGVSLPPGLAYVSDAAPGIRRVRRGAGFAYRDADGKWLSDAGEIARIRALAIPPAYSAVWICPLPHGHLQATARDARGRKQYRYHASWRSHRDEGKFDRLAAFGDALPRIRARVAKDIAEGAAVAAPPRNAVLAALVRLLDETQVRVGNDEYAQSNGSYGLTTLRNDHAGVRGSVLRLRFRGKSGVPHEVALDDPRVARIVRRCQELPGQELFVYADPAGDVRSLDSSAVNDYLHEAAGERFTAKDFRTWHGSVQALELARRACPAADGKPLAVPRIVAEVARQLRNTAAVCRKSYIHPAVLDFCGNLHRRPLPAWLCGAARAVPKGLRAPEWRLLRLLASRPATLEEALSRSLPWPATQAPRATRPVHRHRSD